MVQSGAEGAAVGHPVALLPSAARRAADGEVVPAVASLEERTWTRRRRVELYRSSFIAAGSDNLNDAGCRRLYTDDCDIERRR